MASEKTVAAYQAAIVDLLRERLPDIPLQEVVEKYPTAWAAGINVYRFTRTRKESGGLEFRGTMVRVMYDLESEPLHAEQVERVREVLLEKFGDRWRPTLGVGDYGGFLIEDPLTEYSRKRKRDYEFRHQMGWVPLHELGK